ncbi:RNA polymerase II elongation factor [Cladochytrium tenue]|nr:RNA polymerase II elongation factor [Cladochytrium tenue]
MPVGDADVVEWRREIDQLIRDDRPAVRTTAAAASAVLEVLRRFDGWTPTADSLRATKIGIYVNELRKHSNATDEVREAARCLVVRWKKAVTPGSSSASKPATPLRVRAASSTDAVSAVGSDAASPAVGGSPATPSTPGTATSAAAPLSERSFKSDAIRPASVGDKSRDKTIELLYPAVGLGSDADSGDILRVCTRVEEALHRSCGAVNDQYRGQFRILFTHLKDKNNDQLRERLLAGDISPKELVSMKPEDLMPAKMKERIKQAQQQSIHFSVSAGNQEAETDAFRCGKCGKRKCTYYQKQTRSADEPMVRFWRPAGSRLVACLSASPTFPLHYAPRDFRHLNPLADPEINQ